MARYIDADALLSRLPDDLPYKASVKRVLIQAPTADVAPKSEVAREIVEFLSRRSKSLQHLFKDDPDSAQCFRGRFELENAAVIIANEYGVELKNKYKVEKE